MVESSGRASVCNAAHQQFCPKMLADLGENALGGFQRLAVCIQTDFGNDGHAVSFGNHGLGGSGSSVHTNDYRNSLVQFPEYHQTSRRFEQGRFFIVHPYFVQYR